MLHAQAVRTALSDADGEAAIEPDPAGIGSAAALVAPSDADGSRR